MGRTRRSFISKFNFFFHLFFAGRLFRRRHLLNWATILLILRILLQIVQIKKSIAISIVENLSWTPDLCCINNIVNISIFISESWIVWRKPPISINDELVIVNTSSQALLIYLINLSDIPIYKEELKEKEM